MAGFHRWAFCAMALLPACTETIEGEISSDPIGNVRLVESGWHQLTFDTGSSLQTVLFRQVPACPSRMRLELREELFQIYESWGRDADTTWTRMPVAVGVHCLP